MIASSFRAALHAEGPLSDYAGKMTLYGWLIGSWEMDAVVYREDGTTHRGTGEIHFGWVLEGRAIQDVWILPGIFHGTTLRLYDPGLDAWHIFWHDPLKQYYAHQIGRARGNDIVQDGVGDSASLRWSFLDITPDSFRWLGEKRSGTGEWCAQAEFRARHVNVIS